MRELVFVFAVVWSVSAFATLGGTVDDLATNDLDRLHGTLKANVASAFGTCHKMRTARATICQYAGADGKIFAVTWKGAHHPDLEALFGEKNYQDYLAARDLNPPTLDRKISFYKTAALTVSLVGYHRAMRGHACLNNLIPSGVNCGYLP